MPKWKKAIIYLCGGLLGSDVYHCTK